MSKTKKKSIRVFDDCTDMPITLTWDGSKIHLKNYTREFKGDIDFHPQDSWDELSKQIDKLFTSNCDYDGSIKSLIYELADWYTTHAGLDKFPEKINVRDRRFALIKNSQ